MRESEGEREKREKVIKEKEKWVSSVVRDQSKWLDAALSFVALIEKCWRRKERERKSEKKKKKKKRKKCRARSYVCDCHIGGSSHADSERMKVVIDEEGIASPRLELFLSPVRCVHINHFSSFSLCFRLSWSVTLRIVNVNSFSQATVATYQYVRATNANIALSITVGSCRRADRSDWLLLLFVFFSGQFKWIRNGWH